ncbi:MAG: hypothetical protein ACYCQI_08170 [Gammaproteobacteria bacterium]
MRTKNLTLIGMIAACFTITLLVMHYWQINSSTAAIANPPIIQKEVATSSANTKPAMTELAITKPVITKPAIPINKNLKTTKAKSTHSHQISKKTDNLLNIPIKKKGYIEASSAIQQDNKIILMGGNETYL